VSLDFAAIGWTTTGPTPAKSLPDGVSPSTSVGITVRSNRTAKKSLTTRTRHSQCCIEQCCPLLEARSRRRPIERRRPDVHVQNHYWTRAVNRRTRSSAEATAVTWYPGSGPSAPPRFKWSRSVLASRTGRERSRASRRGGGAHADALYAELGGFRRPTRNASDGSHRCFMPSRSRLR
jgi:hypothetical protein